jgi:hypothetical protein
MDSRVGVGRDEQFVRPLQIHPQFGTGLKRGLDFLRSLCGNSDFSIDDAVHRLEGASDNFGEPRLRPAPFRKFIAEVFAGREHFGGFQVIDDHDSSSYS